VLILTLVGEAPAGVISESFDVFAETEHYSTVVAIELIQHLQSFLPILKHKLRSEKRKIEKSEWDRLDEARINL